jgi:hypothetical protein
MPSIIVKKHGKKMKQVNESQQLKRNGTERCRKYNENNKGNVQTGME